MDWSPLDSSDHGILQAKILEWVAVSSSRGSSRPRDRTGDSCISRRILYHRATREAPDEGALQVKQHWVRQSGIWEAGKDFGRKVEGRLKSRRPVPFGAFPLPYRAGPTMVLSAFIKPGNNHGEGTSRAASADREEELNWPPCPGEQGRQCPSWPGWEEAGPGLEGGTGLCSLAFAVFTNPHPQSWE